MMSGLKQNELEGGLDKSLIAIDESYFLSVCVAIKMDRDGVRWCPELWAKDLALHLAYLKDLTLACPRIFDEPSANDVPLNVAPFDRLKFVDLPSPKNHFQAIVSLPEFIAKMWRGISATAIVHTGFGGWPISEGWFAVPIAKLQKKFVITVIESSFWRVGGRKAQWHQHIRGFISEHLNRLCVNAADLRFFTSKAYREEFVGSADDAYVTPATWIDEAIILTPEQTAQDWCDKSGGVRLLFASRLLAEKGVRVLLDAIEQVGSQINGTITIIGEGPLREECDNFARRSEKMSLKVELLNPIQYGSEFFALLRRFDAVLVPSISEEQPRVIFDAFSQGIPVLGADTGGIREVVDPDVNGKLFLAASAPSLAAILKWASENRETLRVWGAAGLKKSHLFTHRSMHAIRSEIISRKCGMIISKK